MAVEIVVRIRSVEDECTLEQPPRVAIANQERKPCFNNECVICLEEFEKLVKEGHSIVSFNCGHRFCRECAKEHMATQLNSGTDISCPICRNVLMSASNEQYQIHRSNYYHNLQIQHTNQYMVNQYMTNDYIEEVRRQQLLYRQRQIASLQQINAHTNIPYRTSCTCRRMTSLCPCLVIFAIALMLIMLFQHGYLSR